MSSLEAETKFRRGLVAHADRKYDEAVKLFKGAVEEVKRTNADDRNKHRYLSYYGLSLCLVDGASKNGVQFCKVAVKRDPFDPDLLLNLARVYAMTGKKTAALRMLGKGLRLSPHHKGLHAELRILDRRSPPPISFLHRDHPLNKHLGILRAKFQRAVAGKRVREARQTNRARAKKQTA
jgi:tetratricopeptide (TPR) repeat protein